jgi:hypothetical protein
MKKYLLVLLLSTSFALSAFTSYAQTTEEDYPVCKINRIIFFNHTHKETF